MQNIVPDLSVRENLLLAHLGAHRGFGLGYRSVRRRSQAAAPASVCPLTGCLTPTC